MTTYLYQKKISTVELDLSNFPLMEVVKKELLYSTISEIMDKEPKIRDEDKLIDLKFLWSRSIWKSEYDGRELGVILKLTVYTDWK